MYDFFNTFPFVIIRKFNVIHSYTYYMHNIMQDVHLPYTHTLHSINKPFIAGSSPVCGKVVYFCQFFFEVT